MGHTRRPNTHLRELYGILCSIVPRIEKYNMSILKKTTANRESEKALEARLVSEVRKRGGVAVKLTSQFHRGLPDRLVLLPYHTIAFVEMKSTGEKPTALQVAAHEKLRQMRFTVRVIDSTETLDAFLASIDTRLQQQAENDSKLRCEFLKMKRSNLRLERQFKTYRRLEKSNARDIISEITDDLIRQDAENLRKEIEKLEKEAGQE